MLLENLKTALEALFGNRLRSLLTLSGVVIGVFAVTTTISLGQIATAGITGELQAFGAQSLFVSRVFDDPNSTRFTDDDIEALSRLPIEILRSRSTNVWAVAGDVRERISVNGTTENAPQIDRSIELRRGRFFSASDAARGAPVVVLSADAAEALFEGVADPVGREVVLETPGGNRSFYTVIGVKERISGALGAFANDVSGDVPLESLYRDFPGLTRGVYDFLPITIALDRDAAAIEQQVRAILDRRRPPDSYQLQSIEGALGLFNTITVILQALLGGIGGISLLVGGIGILNIMLVSVTERTREIGVRMATGARRSDIQTQFIVESLVVGGLGGIAGVAIGFGIVFVISQIGMTVAVTPLPAILAFSSALATGLVFGLLPARKASRLDPVTALASE